MPETPMLPPAAPLGTPANPIKDRSKKDYSNRDQCFTAEEGNITPLLPVNLADPAMFRQAWDPKSLPDIFTKCRQLLESNDFFGGVHARRMDYFSAGFSFINEEDPAMKKWLEQAREMKMNFRRLSSDIWMEFLACDNAVVFWTKPKEGFPVVIVLDCEICSYSDDFGFPTLKVRPKRKKLSDKDKIRLGPRWSEALEKGKEIEVDPEKGEHFRVLTRQKLGKGFSTPRAAQLMTKLGTLDLLDVADYGGAWEMGDLVNLVTKGHEIKQGEKAGDPRHFLTKKQQQAILQALRNKRGPRRVVGNFDVDITWKYLDPKFFDAKKYDAVLQRLYQWGGGAAMMLLAGDINPNLLDAFQREGEAARGQVSEFLSEILNSEDFYGDLKPPEYLQVTYSSQVWLNQKMLLEWVRAGISTGLISPQTGRKAMGVDTQVEGELLRKAAEDPVAHRPVFEAKQGMLGGNGKGGRPSDNPLAETPPARTNDHPGGHLV